MNGMNKLPTEILIVLHSSINRFLTTSIEAPPECSYTLQYTWCVPLYVIIIPKVAAAISVISSIYLIRLMLSESRRNTYHRIMIAISAFDIFTSTVIHIIGSWAMPVGTAPLSEGTLTTCDAQGFIVIMSFIVSPAYNAALSTYYNLIIKFNWRERRIAKIEKWFYVVPMIIGIIYALFLLLQKQYIPGIWGCWFGNAPPYPPDCNSAETCARGWNSSYYFYPFLVVILVAPVYVAVSMYLIYKHVRHLEKQIAKYQTSTGLSDSERARQEIQNTRKSRRVMEQSLLYSGALFLTLSFTVVELTLNEFGVVNPVWVHVMLALTHPLQGFFNLAIHLRRSRSITSACTPSFCYNFFQRRAVALKTDEENIAETENRNSTEYVLENKEEEMSEG